jgi:hypothetical protein
LGRYGEVSYGLLPKMTGGELVQTVWAMVKLEEMGIKSCKRLKQQQQQQQEEEDMGSGRSRRQGSRRAGVVGREVDEVTATTATGGGAAVVTGPLDVLLPRWRERLMDCIMQASLGTGSSTPAGDTSAYRGDTSDTRGSGFSPRDWVVTVWSFSKLQQQKGWQVVLPPPFQWQGQMFDTILPQLKGFNGQDYAMLLSGLWKLKVTVPEQQLELLGEAAVAYVEAAAAAATDQSSSSTDTSSVGSSSSSSGSFTQEQVRHVVFIHHALLMLNAAMCTDRIWGVRLQAALLAALPREGGIEDGCLKLLCRGLVLGQTPYSAPILSQLMLQAEQDGALNGNSSSGSPQQLLMLLQAAVALQLRVPGRWLVGVMQAAEGVGGRWSGEELLQLRSLLRVLRVQIPRGLQMRVKEAVRLHKAARGAVV